METGLAVAFYILSAVTVVSSLMVVTLKNIMHAILFLVLAFMGVAGLYITLNADFLAAVQVLIYAGAIAVLMIFAILMTLDKLHGSTDSRFSPAGAVMALLVIITIGFIGLNTDWPRISEAPLEQTVPAIADALFNKYVLPFEVASALLLAAMIGAIVLAREE